MSEQFIELVRTYECLYNPQCPEYRDHGVRNNAWEEIAAIENKTIEECKSIWTKLRNCHTNALKRRLKKKSGQAAESILPWRYEKVMSFLIPFMENRPTLTNLGSSPSTSGSELSSHVNNDSSYLSSNDIEPVQRNKKSKPQQTDPDIKEIVDLMKSTQEAKKLQNQMDETDNFFLCMSKSLKKLPKLDQARIKMDLHKAIHDVEIRELERRHSVLSQPIIIQHRKIQPVVTQSPSHSPSSITHHSSDLAPSFNLNQMVRSTQATHSQSPSPSTQLPSHSPSSITHHSDLAPSFNLNQMVRSTQATHSQSPSPSTQLPSHSPSSITHHSDLAPSFNLNQMVRSTQATHSQSPSPSTQLPSHSPSSITHHSDLAPSFNLNQMVQSTQATHSQSPSPSTQLPSHSPSSITHHSDLAPSFNLNQMVQSTQATHSQSPSPSTQSPSHSPSSITHHSDLAPSFNLNQMSQSPHSPKNTYTILGFYDY